MLPQNFQHGRPQNPQYNGGYMQSGDQVSQDSSGMYNNPNLEKQMLALNATSLAKAANRSAPGVSAQSPGLGQSTSNSYFGGNSQLSPDTVPQDFSNGFPQSTSTMNSNMPPSFPDHTSMPNVRSNPPPNNQQQQMAQKRRQFLHGLATVMNQRNSPLPPNLSGVPYPHGYDPTNSPWKMLDISPADHGLIRVAGKDVDLYKLWSVVFSNGGGMRFHQQNAWQNLLSVLELPEQLSPPQHGPTATFLGQIYMNIILPFEEAYRKNSQNQMQKAASAAGRPMPPTVPPPQMQPQLSQNRQAPPGSMGNGPPSGFPHNLPTNTPNMSLVAQAMAANTTDPSISNNMNSYSNAPSPPRTQPPMSLQPITDGRPNMMSNPSTESLPSFISSQQQVRPPSSNGPLTLDIGADMDGDNKKRKMSEDDDGKRTRQKTEPADGTVPLSTPVSANGTTPAATAPRTRRKITYVPLAREVDTMGGRNMTVLGPDLQRALQQRPLKAIHEWGMVEIDALVMSIRSRLASELSYALTTCSLLSVVRDSAKDLPYLMLPQCPDLFEELLDLLEEVAFEGAEEVDEFEGWEEEGGTASKITTMREMENLIEEHESKPFASLNSDRPGIRNAELGPKQRPGDVVLSVVNIMRNWAAACTENMDFMARHPTLLSIMLRVSSIAPRRPNSVVRPASPALSLSDLVVIRKDVTYILFGITTEFRLKEAYERSPVVASQITRRIVELVLSSLMDPMEICVPSAHTTVPYVADNALQIWTRFSQPDDHRKIIGKVISQDWLWQLFQALVHRLPVTKKDYEVITKDTWLTYMEKLMMGIYSLAFLASPVLKHKFKTDKSLGFPGVMLRMVRKFTTDQSQNVREFFSVCARRAIEAMKLVDDEIDMFDTAPTTAPTLSFGVGYGEMGDKGVQKGSGMFGGYAEDITFTIMLAREVDNMLFAELESMVRVEF